MKTTLVLLATATVYLFTACNGNSQTSTTSTEDSATSTSASTDSSPTTLASSSQDTTMPGNGLMKAMDGMMAKMSAMQMSGDFDMDFANMMIEHHQGAIDMSQEELKSGKDEKMKSMAQNIITKQKEEQDKLRDIVKNSKPMKMDMGQHDVLSKEMNDMKTSMGNMQMTGNTDKDFAMMMVAHHESAIKMFKDELSYGMNAQLKQMAQKGISDQTKEIGEFKSWISANK